jgi:hypothetical protein
VFTQISPFPATLGWNILVRKNAFGGLEGKSLPRANLTRNAPPAYGVPAKIKQKCKNYSAVKPKYLTVDIMHEYRLYPS